MLKPTDGIGRTVIDLGGVWKARWGDAGIADLVQGKGYTGLLAVPAAWNCQVPELHAYMGRVWYSRDFFLPAASRGQRAVLRVEGANRDARVYVNGSEAGRHVGGGRPFELDVTGLCHRSAANTLAICCDMMGEGIYPADRRMSPARRGDGQGVPAVRRGFPFGGLAGTVRLLMVPEERITDFDYHTELQGRRAVLHYSAETCGGWKTVFEVDGRTFEGAEGEVEFDSPRLWHPSAPHLYPVTIRLYARDGELLDEYRDSVGLREIGVDGGALTVNGAPVYLRGTSRHDDVAAVGSGLSQAAFRRDVGLMQMTGINVFRTAGAPVSWELAEICDNLGMMIIVDLPHDGFPQDAASSRVHGADALCRRWKAAAGEIVAAIGRHPSVVMWSLENAFADGGALSMKCLSDVCLHLRDRDPYRPVLLAGGGAEIPQAGCFDMAAVDIAGRPEGELGRVLDEAHAAAGSPVVVMDSLEDESSGEAFAALDAAESRDFVAGVLVGTFADFGAGGHHGGMTVAGGGIFTRERVPKHVAWEFRRRYAGLIENTMRHDSIPYNTRGGS
ncbi:MAG: hypothetical protein JW909_04850 [Planctomycetes bacterium]|nr:hypothetical protein [Planctomycetota bacterium]